MSVYVWPALLFIWLFSMGACIGSFLNVCIARMPTGRTPCWPGSHCFSCFQAIGLRDNIPLLSYWLLGGRCRRCQSPFSMRYFWIEFVTACLFSIYYFLDIGFNVHGYQIFGEWGFWYLTAGLFPPWSWPLFIIHALMLAFMLTAALIQWEQGKPDRAVVARGCMLGLIISTCFAWPFPNDWRLTVFEEGRPPLSLDANSALDWFTPRPGPVPGDAPWSTSFYSPRLGFTPWPVFGPLPGWLEGPALGLLTGLAGCALGLVLRGLASGSFALATHADSSAPAYDDGGVLAIAGAYIGWQPILVGFAVAAVLALMWRFAARRKPLPFGLFSGCAVLVCWLIWAWLASVLTPVLFDPLRSLLALVLAAGLAFALRFVRQPEMDAAPALILPETSLETDQTPATP